MLHGRTELAELGWAELNVTSRGAGAWAYTWISESRVEFNLPSSAIQE